MIKKDSVWTGLLAGFALPAIVYYAGIFILKSKESVLGAAFYQDFSLFSLALNGVLVFFFMKKREQDKMGRGIIAATFVYVFMWVFKYMDSI